MYDQNAAVVVRQKFHNILWKPIAALGLVALLAACASTPGITGSGAEALPTSVFTAEADHLTVEVRGQIKGLTGAQLQELAQIGLKASEDARGGDLARRQLAALAPADPTAPARLVWTFESRSVIDKSFRPSVRGPAHWLSEVTAKAKLFRGTVLAASSGNTTRVHQAATEPQLEQLVTSIGQNLMTSSPGATASPAASS